MKVGDKRWKFVGKELHSIVIDSINDHYTHFHYDSLNIDEIDHWAETAMVESWCFETEEDAINARLRVLEKKKKKLESEIYTTRQMLLPYITF